MLPRAPLQHLRAQVLAQQERAEEIHRHDALPLLGSRVFGRRDAAHPGVVDQDVKSGVPRSNRLGKLAYIGLGGDIALCRLHLHALRAQPAEHGIEILHVRQYEFVTLARQQHRGRQPQPLRCAGDQRHTRRR